MYNSSFRYVLIDSRNSPDQLNTVYNAGSIVNVSFAVSLRLYGIGSLLVGEPRYNPKCCPVPAVMPKTHARPESLRITNVGAAAGRGTISKYDSINRDASNTTLRQHGQTIANEKCTSCSLLTGTEIYPGRGFCKCVSE